MICTAKTPLLAVVQGVYDKGRGRYAVATCSEVDGSITFSLQPEARVWEESRDPEAGSEVLLDDITHRREGWRANVARFIRLADHQD